jgi:hypothetical protein
MKDILFWTFWAIFVSTAIITLLAMIGKLRINSKFLNKLFYILIVEVVSAIVLLFHHECMPPDLAWKKLDSYQTVRNFYTAIQNRKYSEAYNLLAPNSGIRKRYPRKDFVKGYDNTVSVRLLSILPQSVNDTCTHEFIIYYLDEVEVPVITELENVHRTRVKNLVALSQKIDSLKRSC